MFLCFSLSVNSADKFIAKSNISLIPWTHWVPACLKLIMYSSVCLLSLLLHLCLLFFLHLNCYIADIHHHTSWHQPSNKTFFSHSTILTIGSPGDSRTYGPCLWLLTPLLVVHVITNSILIFRFCALLSTLCEIAFVAVVFVLY